MLIFIFWAAIIIGLFCGVYLGDRGEGFIGMGAALIAAGIVGLTLFCTMIPMEETSVPCTNFEIAKTSSTVHVEGCGLSTTATDALTYNSINKNTKITVQYEYNSYHRIVGKYLKIN